MNSRTSTIAFVMGLIVAGTVRAGIPDGGEYDNDTKTISGAESASSIYYVGYSGNNNTLTITETGSLSITDADMRIGAADGGNDNLAEVEGALDLSSGSRSLRIGYSSSGSVSGNELKVDGGSVTGYQIRLGDGDSGSGASPNTGNTLTVINGGVLETGSSGYFIMGPRANCTESELLISGDDGAGTNSRVTVDTYFGMTWTTNTGSNNATVEDGGELHVGTYAIVGRIGGDDNVLNILSGGNMTVGDYLLVGGTSEDDDANHGSANHTITVNGTGSKLSTTANLTLGGANDANGNSLTVQNNGTVEVGDYANIGSRGKNNTVSVLSGGNVTVNTQLRIGSEAPSEDNRLTVSGEDSAFTTLSVHVGRWGSNNTIEVLDGATFTANGVVGIGRLSTAANNTLRVSGEGSTFLSNSTITVDQEGGGGNELNVEAKGLVSADAIDVSNTGAFNVDEGTAALADSLTVGTDADLAMSGNSVVHIGDGYDSVTNDYSANLLRVANNGTVTANGGMDLGTGGTVLVQAGGILQGATTITGDGDVYGVLNPGNSAGNLTFTGTLTLRADSEVNIELGAGGVSDKVTADTLTIEGGTLVFTLLDGYTPEYEDTFTIAAANNLTGTFDSIDDSGLGGSWSIDDSDLYTLGTVTIIPEPHSLGMILLGLVGVGLRRRFRKI